MLIHLIFFSILYVYTKTRSLMYIEYDALFETQVSSLQALSNCQRVEWVAFVFWMCMQARKFPGMGPAKLNSSMGRICVPTFSVGHYTLELSITLSLYFKVRGFTPMIWMTWWVMEPQSFCGLRHTTLEEKTLVPSNFFHQLKLKTYRKSQ